MTQIDWTKPKAKVHTGGVTKWADVSLDSNYRYTLGRDFEGVCDDRQCVFVMLNPSTADALVDDPTVRKCVGFAKRLGFGSLIVINLFAYRATKPSALTLHRREGRDAAGPDNALHVSDILHNTSDYDGDRIIVAWGSTSGRKWVQPFADVMLENIADAGRTAYRIGPALKDGNPRHPLMAPYAMALEVH